MTNLKQTYNFVVEEENLNFVSHKAALIRAGAWPGALKVSRCTCRECY